MELSITEYLWNITVSVMVAQICIGFYHLMFESTTPDFSHPCRMGDMIQEFLEVFAVVAHTIVKKVLEKNTALLQDVSSSSFPKVGQPPVVHQVNQNLKFKKHAVRAFAAIFW